MTLPPRRAAAAAALLLAGTLTATACGSGAPSSQAPTTTSSSSPSSTAPSTGAAGTSGTGASPSGTASSGPATGGASSPTGDRHRDKAKHRKAKHQKAKHQKAKHQKAKHQKADRRRRHVRERKRLINACVHDTKTLNEAVSTYNAAVSSGDQDDLDYAAAVLREAAGSVDHKAERAGNHRLTRLSNRVVGDLGTIASLIEQGDDVPSSSGHRLTRHSTKLHSFCSDKV
ncbi:MAG TPA: hypothetical protein VFJ12_15650 [Segeticoccus sp.]|nr:hypothetical protein [Segeticoccus sp.]